MARIPFPSMGVEREKQDKFAPEFEPCTSAACVHVERDKKGEIRRSEGGDKGGILGDEEGTLQPHNVGMVEGGLCDIGAEEVEGRPEGEAFEGGVGGRGRLGN